MLRTVGTHDIWCKYSHFYIMQIHFWVKTFAQSPIFCNNYHFCALDLEKKRRLVGEYAPNGQCGVGCGDVYLLLGNGVDETHFSGMQTDASVGVWARWSILQVTLDCRQSSGELAPDLVVATCMEVYLKQGISVACVYDLIIKCCLLAALHLFRISVGLVLLFVTR